MILCKKIIIIVLNAVLIGILTGPSVVSAFDNEIFDLELSDLMQIQITSAGRKEQNLVDVPAAVYVINAEDISRSSATSLPELLRLVPGLQVARIGSSKWAVSSRGFNGTFSNKLLVQIDGRTVYMPSYSGVYWDMQTVMLNEIDRIEVIRGPGATLWGANAVNGVINIITKAASDSSGLLISAGTGNQEKVTSSLRYGKQVGDNSYGKLYFEYHDRKAYTYQPNDSDAYRYYLASEDDSHDDWDMLNGGFRLDGDIGLKNSWTIQGDLYSGKEAQQVFPYWTEIAIAPTNEDDLIKAKGYNLLARWERRFSAHNNWTLQSYYDYSKRDEIYVQQIHKTIDVDFQHRFQLGSSNDIVWGTGYRHIIDEFENSDMVGFYPEESSSNLYSCFIQDEIRLIKDRLSLTLGSKFEQNDSTGTEIQPSARLMWQPQFNHRLWASISRAVRTPSRAERSVNIIMRNIYIPDLSQINPNYPPIPALINVRAIGNEDLDSEKILAYEVGYRYASGENFSVDLTAFHIEYKDITDYYQTSDGLNTTIDFVNGIEGHSQGFELNLQWQPRPWLTTEANYGFIRFAMDSMVPIQLQSTNIEHVHEKSSPRHQASLKVGIDLRDDLQLNLFGRYVDDLEIPSSTAAYQGLKVDDYVAVDANIIWDIYDNLEFKLAGQNLTDPQHLEFINEYFTPAIEVGRSIYAQLTFSY